MLSHQEKAYKQCHINTILRQPFVLTTGKEEWQGALQARNKLDMCL